MTTTPESRPRIGTGSEDALAATFPPGFLWGVATAAYQIEGATREDGRGPSIWDRFSAAPGNTRAGDTGDTAANHYHLMEQDVALMSRLGVNAYRFSIAWPRVIPEGTGSVNVRGLDFYDRLTDALLERGIEPVATLYHWDLPLALQSDGGWLHRDTSAAFAAYAEVVARRLGDRITRWITLNEPWCSSYLGHGIGVHAPGARSMQAAATAAHHLLLAHGLAVPRLHEFAARSANVGITLNLTPVYAADGRPETLDIQRRVDTFHNRWFLDPVFRGAYPEGLFTDLGVSPPPIMDGDLATIAVPIDFLGVNYYSRLLIRAHEQRSAPVDATPLFERYDIVGPVPGSRYTEMGWEVYPDGLVDILMRVHRDYAPRAITVTENGAAYADAWDGGDGVKDVQRTEYFRKHIQALAVALLLEVPVDGYFAWSLIDNFEWAEGYSRRFGVVYVDYPSQRRIIKDSGLWYADFLAAYRNQVK
jgi:beta-glucosidase